MEPLGKGCSVFIFNNYKQKQCRVVYSHFPTPPRCMSIGRFLNWNIHF